ncbi:sigma-E processing peptidase SpoIIGA, partial [Clostridium cadaveris]
MKIYIDVLLFENFLVNLFLMYITSETMSITPKIKKMIFPSIIAASYTLVVFLKNEKFLNSVFFKIGIVAVFL